MSSSTTEGASGGPSPTISKFDQNASRMKLVKMFVKSELPFRFVEDEDFRDFVRSLQPRFEVPSRTTLRREMWQLYEEESQFLSPTEKVLSPITKAQIWRGRTWTSR